MRWVPELCRSAPGADPNVPDHKACWALFVDFARQMGTEAANFISPRTGSAMGWQGDAVRKIQKKKGKED